MNRYGIVLLVLLLISVYEVNAHPLFNSETKRIAGYKIQIATNPEIPSENENTKIMVAVTGNNDEDIGEVILSLRLMQGENTVLLFGPKLIKGGHLTLDYTFKKPGEYIAIVNIHESQDTISVKFNISVTRLVSMIFITLVIIGMLTPVGLLLVLRLLKNK